MSSGKTTILRFEPSIFSLASAYLKAFPLPQPETLGGSMLNLDDMLYLQLPIYSATVSCLCPSKNTKCLNPSFVKDSMHMSINFLLEVSRMHLGLSIAILFAFQPVMTAIWFFFFSFF